MLGISAVILIFGNFIFIFFAKFEIQRWNGDHDLKLNIIDRRASGFSRNKSFDVPIDSWRGVRFSNEENIVPEYFNPHVKNFVIRDERFDPRGSVFGPSRRESLSSRR